MFPVITLPKADIDSDLFFLYIAKDSLKSAYKFLDRIQETYAIISEFPLMAPIFETTEFSSIRWFPIKDFPHHLIFYTVDETQITIIRVLHKSQDISEILNDA